MPADSLHCKISAAELNASLSGGKIDKITMPDPDEVVLFVRANSVNRICILSANPSLPRVHLTAFPPKNNPLTAPSFLMHLRKNIGGAAIDAVDTYHGERIILFHLRARNELGYEEKRTLICEVMGKYANIILVGEDGKISDSIKHISPSSSEKRPILPHILYSFPPKQDKVDLSDGDSFTSLLEGFGGGKLDSYILAGGAGLAPATISAIVTHTLGVTTCDRLTPEQIDKLRLAFDQDRLLKSARPCVGRAEGGKTDFWLYPFYQDGEYEFYPTLNEAMDGYFATLDADRRLRERAHVPKTTVKNAIARTEKKLKLFTARRDEASDLERDRLYGELIIANIYRLKQGMKSAVLENYYADPPETVTIPLDEKKSPQFNAQAYFKKYAKKKKTLSMVENQIEEAKRDLEYYKSIYDSFEYTDLDGLEEIVSELIDAGLIHQPKDKRKKKEKTNAGGEITYRECIIRWGKTNLQNDRITKQAKNNDLWLHTQKIHGSHVIVSGEKITDEVILRAAEIAAYYSKGRLSEKVPVDYTLKKYVSKPKGSPPGKVVYTDYKTVLVTPRDERVN